MTSLNTTRTHQHKAAGKRTGLDVQNQSDCNGGLLGDHGVVEIVLCY